ncbi:GGDEF domain-containing protein [Kineosporia sp. J2-2]|uniref:GGDEF domain-containing protein n=1 Tax=Kineosporia corallincola TaxID=2835133 RepID=A0ABS5TE82_9ACTN|nr:GGDEF domain-containing protein [Kineosporia corallincola]MBT0769400.1 GGDEF domain-containing protein [Kineosporia corallincola]
MQASDRASWRLPPHEAVLTRMRWIAMAVVLTTVLGCAPVLVSTADRKLLLVATLAGIAVSLVTGYRLGRLPIAMEVFDVLCFVVVLVFVDIPMVAFGIGFQNIWYRCLFTGGRRALLRAVLYAAAFAAGALLWAAVQVRPDPELVQAYVVAGVLSTFSVTFLGWQLADSLIAREASSRRERLISETGGLLLGATDEARIRQTGWRAIDTLAADTPGLRAVRVARTANGLEFGRASGFMSLPPAFVSVTDDVGLGSPQMRGLLTAVLEDGCVWELLVYDELPGVAFALGHPRRVPPDVVATAASILNQVLLAHRNSVAHAELLSQALTDPLTGLANRQGFTEATGRLLAEPGLFTVMFIDLDDFKNVNDNLGHAAGDDLLMRVAVLLRGLVRDGDVVARLGGDEFAVLLSGTDEETARRIAGRIVLGVSGLRSGPDGEYTIGASIGLVTAGSGIGLPELLVRADVAMYQAKAQGKGRMQTWRPGLLPNP